MNKYQEFILKELYHHFLRHEHTDPEIRPGLSWKGEQKFVIEAIRDLVIDKFVLTEFASCSNCKKRCGHTYVSLTELGTEKAKEIK